MQRKSVLFSLLVLTAVSVLCSCGGETDPGTYMPTYVITPAILPTQSIPTDEPYVTDAPTAAPTDGPMTKMFVDVEYGSTLRVRSGAGTSYDILGYLNKNDVVLLLESDVASGWHKIMTYDGTIGFASSKMLSPTHEKAVLSDLKKYTNEIY